MHCSSTAHLQQGPVPLQQQHQRRTAAGNIIRHCQHHTPQCLGCIMARSSMLSLLSLSAHTLRCIYHQPNDHGVTTMVCCCCQVVYGHLDDPEGQELERGVSYLKLRPGAASFESSLASSASSALVGHH
jgi:hypothetical protein